MQCDEFGRRLNWLLDQRKPAEEDTELQWHAADCTECQQLLAGQARLLEMVRFEILPLPDAFVQQTVRLSVPNSRPSRRRPQIVAAILATAATLLIVAAPIARRFNSPSLAEVKHKEPRPAHQKAPPVTPTTIGTWQPGAQPTATRAESEELRRMIKDLWENLPTVPQEQLEPIDRLAGGLKPLASTLGAALDALRRSFPVGREEESHEPQANFLGWSDNVRLG